MLTIETFQDLDSDDLHDTFCDWYKSITGIKPRWVDPNDREYILDWIANELRPEVAAARMEKVLEEQAWFAEMDALEAERILQSEEAREEELEEYYYSLERHV